MIIFPPSAHAPFTVQLLPQRERRQVYTILGGEPDQSRAQRPYHDEGRAAHYRLLCMGGRKEEVEV
jgi:hypothetical protein